MVNCSSALQPSNSFTRVQLTPSFREINSPRSRTETNQTPGRISRSSGAGAGHPSWNLSQLAPSSRQTYSPLLAAAMSVSSAVHSRRMAPPESSGKSCHFQVRPASSEKIIALEETIRNRCESLDTRTEFTGKLAELKESADHALPLSDVKNNPSWVAAKHSASPHAKSLTTASNLRAGVARRSVLLVTTSGCSTSAPSRVHLRVCESNRARPPDASAANQPPGEEKIRVTAFAFSPAPIADQVRPPSSESTGESTEFARTAAMRPGLSASIASEMISAVIACQNSTLLRSNQHADLVFRKFRG